MCDIQNFLGCGCPDPLVNVQNRLLPLTCNFAACLDAWSGFKMMNFATFYAYSQITFYHYCQALSFSVS